MQEMNISSVSKSKVNFQSLTKTIKYAIKNSLYYQRTLTDIIGDADFTLDNYRKLPFTTKEDLAANNKDFLCVPKNKINCHVQK